MKSIAFTEKGRQTARRIGALSQKSPRETVKDAFANKEDLVFVGATGIAVRMIAPYLRSKETDPAVIVIDELGQYVIPLVSGHLGGANALARQLAEKLRAIAVVTTATDINGCFAIDDWCRENNCAIADIGCIKLISAALLRQEPVGLASALPLAGALPPGFTLQDQGPVGVYIGYDGKGQMFDQTLNVIPKDIIIGAGCKRGTDAQALIAFAERVLQAKNICPKAIRAIATIDIKAEEPAMLQLAEHFGVDLHPFPAETLLQQQGNFTPSPFVKSVTGVDNVCQRAAAAAGAICVSEKCAENGMTLALGTAERTICFAKR